MDTVHIHTGSVSHRWKPREHVILGYNSLEEG